MKTFIKNTLAHIYHTFQSRKADLNQCFTGQSNQNKILYLNFLPRELLVMFLTLLLTASPPKEHQLPQPQVKAAVIIERFDFKVTKMILFS